METSSRSAVLVVRVWVEDGDPRQVRARVTREVGDQLAVAVETSASSVEGVCRLVREEIERLLPR